MAITRQCPRRCSGRGRQARGPGTTIDSIVLTGVTWIRVLMAWLNKTAAARGETPA